jgi:dTDP-4-amino-4,6-dideoxygalactose transaminase
MIRVPVMLPRAPSVKDAYDRLASIDASRWYANLGPQEQDLRRRLANRLKVSPAQVATVANATLGLAGSVSVLGGGRWLVPTYTFAATPSAVIAAGAEVVFGDVAPLSWVLEPEGAVDGYLPVAPFGAPPDLTKWRDHPRVVHDAAASMGEELDLSDLPAGHAVVFSVHATKVLGSGEGGIVVFGDPENAARFRSWTNFGFAGTRESQVSGTNAKMSEIQCAYVHAALDGWSEEHAEWTDARSSMVRLLDELNLPLFDTSREGINPYVIALFDDERQSAHIERTLSQYAVETRRWWSRCCHTMPAYRDLDRGAYPISENAAGRSLGLPFFRGLNSEHLERIAEALRRGLAGMGAA